MFKDNNKIDSIQLFALAAMLGNSLFVGMGNIILVLTVHENVWIVPPLAIIIGLIPLFFIIKLMNYSPELNFIEKIKKIFGNKIGFIINILLILIIFLLLVMSIWGVGIFAGTKYLTETPLLFIVFLITTPVFYAAAKGIETIARAVLIFLYIGIFCHIFITSSLAQFSMFENVKPILVDGVKPVLEGVGRYLSYNLLPYITLLIIPKNKIKDSKNSTKAIIMGFIYSTVIMSIVFYMSISTVGVHVASMYKYPEYFIMKKISIGMTFDNIENFFSIVWIYNMLTCSILSLYYIKEYISDLFKIKKEKVKTMTIFFVSVIAMFLASFVFKSDASANAFMRIYFPVYVGIPTITILVLSFIIIKIKQLKNKL